MDSGLNDYWTKIRNGDERALEDLFRLINNSLLEYIEYLTKDRSASQEILLDVFLKLWQNRSKIEIKGSVKSYIFKFAHNESINYLIRIKSKKYSSQKLLPGEIWLAINESRAANSYLIERLEADETEMLVSKAIEELPEQCQKVFIFSRFENKSNQEISQLLNISPHTVRVHIYKALNMIKSYLEKKS